MRNYLFRTSRIAAGSIVLLVCGSSLALNYEVNFTSQPPAVDGSASDASWSAASPAATNFVVYNDIATQSNQQTQVRLLWDSTYLYLLYEATDNSIVSTATGSDYVGFFANQDIAEVYLDPAWSQSNTTANSAKTYHIAVDASTAEHTYTEAPVGWLGWDLSNASQVAFAPNGTSWNVEMAIAWDDLNSSSPGVIIAPPNDGTIWGAQFGRTHSMVNDDNNTTYTKWNNGINGGFRSRPFGTLSFKGGPAAAKVDLSGKKLNKAFGFEPPTYTDGNTIVGTENWTSSNANSYIASSVNKYTGTQSLRIGAAGSAYTATNVTISTNVLTTQYLQYALYLPSEHIVGSEYRHVLYVRGVYDAATEGSTEINTLANIWFRSSTSEGSNIVTVYSYEDPLDQALSFRSNYPGFLAYNTWMFLTVKVDPLTKQFEVWLNDTQLINQFTDTQYFAVRNRDKFHQMSNVQLYSKSYGVDPVYLDDMTFYEDPGAGIDDWQLF